MQNMKKSFIRHSSKQSSTKDTCHLYGKLLEKYENEPKPEKKPSVAKPPSDLNRVPSTSMLVTGFGIRNLESLQRALLSDRQRRQLLLAKYSKDEEEFECISLQTSQTSGLTSKTSSSATIGSQSDSGDKSFSLNYLMGLGAGAEEEIPGERETPFIPELPPMEGELDEFTGVSSAMRKAQKYLRSHRIFEFFQFLIAHMLSALPDDPIGFLLDLLDKCLIYRSGLGNPPLLYEKAHLEQLFYLMDRMRTGFIEVEQYKTGMSTLGICNYDKSPKLCDGMVSTETFVEEAYDCLTDLFHDMVRRRGAQSTPQSIMTPPPTEVTYLGSAGSDGGQ